MEEFKINLGNLKVDQLGFVYKDIEKQAKIMESMFGFSKFIFGDWETKTIKFRGNISEVTSRIAFSRLGSTQVELIQWKSGDCSYNEFLDKGNEGFHHIACYIENTDSYIKEFEKIGIGILQEVEVLYTRCTYMDTRGTFGIIVELLEKIKRRKKSK
ncbi:MAG: VOC family protein [Candidatus Lokiarchaeota archaeon]|nr:VOC family protein [Candidatus Lokiarchaeota archaeon]